MTRVRRPISAERTPVAAATDVFPTPPFPAKKMILNRKLPPEELAAELLPLKEWLPAAIISRQDAAPTEKMLFI
jgi:hypothetical protein